MLLVKKMFATTNDVKIQFFLLTFMNWVLKTVLRVLSIHLSDGLNEN